MAKLGTAYEGVVAEVMGAMDADADVQRGVWVAGPDGRRDLDVIVTGEIEGRKYRVLIECKDYNPDSTGPVGIELVDALESKRRDVGVDVALICSNGGFTSGAISKAKRVQIGLISILKEKDDRVRFAVREQLYTRQIRLERIGISLRGDEPISLRGVPFDAVLFEGKPIGNWVKKRLLFFLGANPVVNGSHTATHNLKQKVTVELPDGMRQVKGIDIHWTISGNWHVQDITIDSTGAVYDWLRRRVHRMPGDGQFKMHGVDVYAGRIVRKPPEWVLDQELRLGEMNLSLVLIRNWTEPGDAPDVSRFVEDKDLSYVMNRLPEEAISSADV